MMRNLRLAAALALSLLAGCATLQPVPTGQKLIGAPQTAVQTTFGPPTDIFPLANGTSRWIYSKQPMGRDVYAADFDHDGRLTNFRQMLDTAELYKAQVGVWTKQDVIEHFGRPQIPVDVYPRMQREAWSYRFLHEGLWPSLFNFYFDPEGVLRQTQITPDPLYNPDRLRR